MARKESASARDVETSSNQLAPWDQYARGMWGPAAAYWWNAALDYTIDAAQRATLFWDVMRQRGNQYLEQSAQAVPHVLSFEFEPVLTGRELARPVNYGLVRVVPKPGTTLDPKKRPFVIVDPRAGHGPGIGGFKADSEIGVALKAGHPCYFIGFTPEPMPGQTIEDVIVAIVTFLEKVNGLHAEADGRPTVVGNCQAGWAVLMAAATRPDLFGPIIAAGSPLSYWAGVRGVNPMRYTGGMVGGSWPATLLSDLGNGTFDGAWLVQNFENLNPSNTLWTKQYHLYANIDTEAPRYLGFEKWWGQHVLLTGDEIQFIVDELFVGNKLSNAGLRTTDGMRIDLRSIRGPIIVFASKGDDITPPQQALGWILDLYKDVNDIRIHGQTIVYTIHETVGHLGIFVSGGVARKEHGGFTSNIDLIDVLPPGLYEAVFTEEPRGTSGADAGPSYIATFTARTLDDIRALGGNDIADERCFAAVARTSEITSALYRQFASPAVKSLSNKAMAEGMQHLHPSRLQYEMFSDRNPLMAGIAQLAPWVRANRRQIESDNPFLALQASMSQGIVAALDSYRDTRDRLVETTFLAVYGSPVLQSAVGLGPSENPPRPLPGDSADHVAFVRQRAQELRDQMDRGGPREAAVRALIYCGMADDTFDERAFAVLIKIREDAGGETSIAAFKQLAREQYYMLLLDEERALAGIPAMLGSDHDAADRLLTLLPRVAAVRGPLSDERKARLSRIATLIGRKRGAVAHSKPRSVA